MTAAPMGRPCHSFVDSQGNVHLGCIEVDYNENAPDQLRASLLYNDKELSMLGHFVEKMPGVA